MINLIQGDGLVVLKDIDDGSIDMVLTDIPYNEVNRQSNGLRNLDKGKADIINFELKDLLSELCRVTIGSMYIFCGIEQVSEIKKLMVSKNLSVRLVIWNKTNPSPMNGRHIWLSSIECCVYGKFPKATFKEHCKGSVLNYPSGKGKVHPTEKPINLFQYIVETSSNEGDTVLDLFMGSGTTGVACVNTDRKFIGIELDEGYFKIAQERIKQAQARKAYMDKNLKIINDNLTWTPEL